MKTDVIKKRQRYEPGGGGPGGKRGKREASSSPVLAADAATNGNHLRSIRPTGDAHVKMEQQYMDAAMAVAPQQAADGALRPAS